MHTNHLGTFCLNAGSAVGPGDTAFLISSCVGLMLLALELQGFREFLHLNFTPCKQKGSYYYFSDRLLLVESSLNLATDFKHFSQRLFNLSIEFISVMLSFLVFYLENIFPPPNMSEIAFSSHINENFIYFLQFEEISLFYK